MRRKLLFLGVTLTCAAGLGYLVLAKQQLRAVVIPTPEPKFEQPPAAAGQHILRLTGQTSARNFVNMTAPRQRGPESDKKIILMKLVKNGAFVHKGQLIAEIDAQSVKDHIDDIADTVRQAEADITKRKAEQAIEWEQLLQGLRTAKADAEKARLDAKTTALLTDIERELLQLSVEETEARYKKLQEDLTNHRAANESELRILEITRKRHQLHHDRHQVDLNKFTIYAPTNGLAVMQSIWRGGEMGQVQEGDQVWPGQLYMRIVDTSSMQVEARANQAESSQIHIGQSVQIALDAFPGLQFSGKVYSIGALATGGWIQNFYVRTIPVRIAIEGSDPRLIPDLSAAADVLVDDEGHPTS
jgi:HlyD family secretion protein